jgi:hypothetical protein
MRTVGVDLASQPAKTAICTIEWADGTANVEALGLGRLNGRILDDLALPAAMRLADKAAIDAPLDGQHRSSAQSRRLTGLTLLAANARNWNAEQQTSSSISAPPSSHYR